MSALHLRWLVLALLVANGVYFYWQNFRDTPVLDFFDTSGEQLLLLSEVETSPVQAEEELAAPRIPSPPTRWFGGGVTTQLAEIELPESAQRLEISAELAAAFAQSGAGRVDSSVAAGSAGEAAAGVEPTIEPVAESVPVAQPETPAAAIVAEPEPQVAAAPRVRECWRAGPLKDSSEQQLATLFKQQGLEMRLLPRKVVTETKYWVYVETANNPDIRKQTRAALLEAGIDNYVIAGGALAGDLSLGLFRQQKRAEGIAAQRRGQGFLAKVYPVEKVEEKNWLLLDSEEAGTLGWPADLKTVPGEPELQLKPMKCEERPQPQLQGRRDSRRALIGSQLARLEPGPTRQG